MRTGTRVLLTLTAAALWQTAQAAVPAGYSAEEWQAKLDGVALDAARPAQRPAADADREGGPDAAGYYWRSNTDPGGPAVNFFDISGVGTVIAALSNQDDLGTLVALPRPFTYYGTAYNNIWTVTNGWLSFVTLSGTTLTNVTIPTAATPNGVLAPFWDDMDLSDTSGSLGNIYQYDDAGNSRFIIQWNDVPHFTGTPASPRYTFQVQLYDDGRIVYQYENMDGILNSATIGIENLTGTGGLLCNFNGAGVFTPASNTAIEFVQLTGDIVAPAIVHTALGSQVGANAPFEVSASVTDASGITSVDLIYNAGAGDVTVAMTNTSGDIWESSIPSQPALTTVSYRIRAVDSGNNSLAGVSGPYTFIVLDAIDAFPYQQNFDAFANLAFPFTEQWANSTGNNSWHAGTNTPTSPTGASADHTSGTGKFIYCESSNGVAGNLYTVSSPFFDLDALGTPLLKFWYHMCGATTGTLNVDVYEADSATYTLGVWTLTGQQQALETSPWLEASVPLDAFSGAVQIRFRGVRGSSFTGDISVDDFFLGEAPSFDVSLDVDSFASPVSAIGNLDVAVTVTNVGASIADVDVKLDYDGIAGPDATAQILGLAPAASQQVFFTPASPAAGTYAYSVEAVVTNGTDGAPADNTESGSYDVFDSSLPPSALTASDDQLDQISLSWSAPAWVVALVGDLRPREITVADLPFVIPAGTPADKVAAVLAEYEAAHPQWQFENASRAFLNYNIYRDGNLVGTTAGLSFVDNLANGVVINTAYDYTVTALWDEEESAASNTDSGMAVGRPTAGGPDALGYTWVNSNDPTDPATFNWVEISGIGTNLAVTGDDVSMPQALPFSFPLYTGSFTSVNVSSNGFLNFGGISNTFTNIAVPGVALPNSAIFALWDDLNTGTTGTVHYYDDSATNDRVIFQWTGVPRLAGDGTFTFQVILNDDGTFQVQYLSIAGVINSATVGCEDAAGTTGLQVHFNNVGGAIADGVAIDFAPGTGDFIAPVIDHTQTITSIETELAGDYTISATITDDSGVASADLTYNNGSGAVVVPMTNTVGDTWAADIPHQLAGLTVTYSISATDAGSNSATGSTGNYSFTVVSVSWAIDDVVASDGLYGQTNITWTAPGAPAPAPVRPGSLDEKTQAMYDARERELAEAGRAFLNYNVYRDGNFIGATATSPFVDTAMNGATEGVEYTYTVTSLYTSGESPASNGDLGSFVARPTNGGPDTFGYVWHNSEDAIGPDYVWNDITGNPNSVAVALGDDAASAAIPLGFDFPFYGVDQSSIFIGSNGVLAFGTAVTTFTNTVFPTVDSNNNIIAPFWDDLDPGDAVGTIHYLSDIANSRFVVQYTGVPEYPGPGGFPHTFQAVLNADGSILFYYHTMTGGSLIEATVGVESAGGTDGLTANFDDVGSTLLDGTSIRIGLPQAAPVPVVSIVRNPGNTVTLNWSDEGMRPTTCTAPPAVTVPSPCWATWWAPRPSTPPPRARPSTTWWVSTESD
jgi:hypothetical protein